MLSTKTLQAFADEDHKRAPNCTWCGKAGIPYEYRGVHYDGLVNYKGDRLCSRCTDVRMDTEGIDTLVIDDRPSIPSYVVNTVRDRDVIHIWIPPERRGIDGRDARPRRTRKERKRAA